MAEKMDAEMPVKSTSQYLHPEVENEAFLAAITATYFDGEITPESKAEYAPYFMLIRDGGEAAWTEETLATVEALRPSIDYYTKALPYMLLKLSPFAETNRSDLFGPLPPVEGSDLHRFQRALYRFQAQCEATRKSCFGRLRPRFYYEDLRSEIRPYSDIEENQSELVQDLLRSRMFEDTRDTLKPHDLTRTKRYFELINGIMCQGLQFMHQLEMEASYEQRERIIRRIESNDWELLAMMHWFIPYERSEEAECARHLLAAPTGGLRGGSRPCRRCERHEREDAAKREQPGASGEQEKTSDEAY
ncbi:unnamed protein product [Clonostachys rosea]|uniref:Uncharacterized protein n=1 Tax=Bionectria ochroleuca TaxID=29856 RepID=A0ABY6UZ19_BIOOC|nr:unnamed protein product [Clonostachys rosea]